MLVDYRQENICKYVEHLCDDMQQCAYKQNRCVDDVVTALFLVQVTN